jgi:hypothetical protein
MGPIKYDHNKRLITLHVITLRGFHYILVLNQSFVLHDLDQPIFPRSEPSKCAQSAVNKFVAVDISQKVFRNLHTKMNHTNNVQMVIGQA